MTVNACIRDSPYRPRYLSRYTSRLTSSSPSRAEDSFCKTAMSRREDIVSCIDVTIMDRSAHSALPSPDSKIFPAFRAKGQRFSRGNRMSQWRKGLLACAVLTLITHPPLSKALPADLRRDAIAAATADPTRPGTDTARDANRKPAETLEFAGVKPDDKIADYAAGAGYFTRLF